jgi:glycosyltransferase involved in cell wall biosynthesis
MFKTLLLSLKSLIFGNFLPCYVISRKPFILISYWHDFITHSEKIISHAPIGRNAYFLFQLGWHRETAERVKELKHAVDDLKEKHPRFKFIFLCNSLKEEKLLKEATLNCIFCHQNAFLNENNYHVIPCAKTYDAIYLARITPFKRHQLAIGIKKLHLVGDHHPHEKEYFETTLKLLQHADWDRKIYAKNVYKEMNKAKIGLCLSAEEGAMFVSAEYLLCGLPVISTRNLGGRDGLFDDEYALIVNDTTESIADGVKTLISKNIDPNYIRQCAIEKMTQHRNTFVQLVQGIYNENSINKNFRDEWTDVFIHKFGLRCSMSPSAKKSRFLAH